MYTLFYSDYTTIPEGTYTIKASFKFDGVYIRSDEVVVCEGFKKLQKLDKPTIISSENYVYTWESVANATGYVIRVYNPVQNRIIDTHYVGADVNSFDFSELKNTYPQGSYYIYMFALGDNVTYGASGNKMIGMF